MDRCGIVTGLDPDSVAALVACLREAADVASSGALARTRSDRRVKQGVATPPAAIGRFWYVRSGATLSLDHRSNRMQVLHLDDEGGTRTLELDGVLPDALTRAACHDAAVVGAAIGRLATALADGRIAASHGAARLVETLAEGRPEGVGRAVALRAPTPFRHASLKGVDREGATAARITPAGRARVLAALGRLVAVDVPDPMRRSWRVAAVRATASPIEPDAVARLRLAAEAATDGAPAMAPTRSVAAVVPGAA